METPSTSEAERGDTGTTTSGTEEGGPSGSEARKDRKRKKREPNKLGTTQHAFTEVDPKSGLPTKPGKYVKGPPAWMHRSGMGENQRRKPKGEGE